MMLASTAWGDTFWAQIIVPLATALIAAVAAAGIAVTGYRREQASKRRDHLRNLFAESLEAVADYQEMPYRICRRSDNEPMTPTALASRVSDVQARLDFYVARLDLESPEVGHAYSKLVGTVRAEAGAQMTDAWHRPRIESDAEMPLRDRFPRELAESEKLACIAVMQKHLGIAPATR